MNSSKQEYGHDTNNSKFSSSRTTPSSSRQSWAGFKNPRIVRVSRSFGGKDRHSKVCTIRGLRDRRIRLSVPTAIQLYDLQERLGLSQPSKVVDWLLDATKDDIDKLPPLHFPPASVSHLFNPSTPCMKGGVKIGDNFDGNLREKSTLGGKDKWFASSDHEQENQEGTNIGGYVPLVSSQNLFQLGNQSSLPAGMYNTMPFTSNLSLAPFGNNSFSSQTETCHQNNNLPISLASSNSFPSGSQLYFCQNGTTLSPIVPQYMTTNNSQFNHFHLLNSSSPLVPTLQLISSKGLNSQEDQDDHDNHLPHKEGTGSYHLKKL